LIHEIRIHSIKAASICSDYIPALHTVESTSLKVQHENL